MSFLKYQLPFLFHQKKNVVAVEYNRMCNPYESGFHILNPPFDANECAGFPMLHAYIENSDLKGYERYCGWIQLVQREEFIHRTDAVPTHALLDLDVCKQFRQHQIPYFSLGYPSEFFDAPCHNLNGYEKLIWRAYTYLVDVPSRANHYQASYLTGFSWGYMEDCQGNVTVLAFQPLTEDTWNQHKRYLEVQNILL